MNDDEPRYWIIDNPSGQDDPSLPHPNARRGGSGPFIFPIVDETYGGVIAWANTYELAEKIVEALTAAA